MLNRIYDAGVDIGVYTSKVHVDESQYAKISNYRDDVVRESDIYYTLLMMTRSSLYKMLPFAIKNTYFYDTSDISWMVKYGEVWTDYNDLPFYERITNEGLAIDDSLSGTFRFYHMRGAHYPYYLSDDMKFDRTRTKASPYSQNKASMSIVYLYLEKLKELGLYDDTTIIITADHGDIISYDKASNSLSDVSRPILFVKHAGDSGDSLKYNHAQVSHKEMISTVLDSFGLEYSQFGPRLEDIEEDSLRERYFGYFSDYVITGKVIGNGAELSNWMVD